MLKSISRKNLAIRSPKFIHFAQLILTLLLVSSFSFSQPSQDGFMYWMIGIPNADTKNNSGTARVDGRMYCTDAYNLWQMSAWVENHTQCTNGARVINVAELDGYLGDYAVDTYGETTDQATLRWIVRTTVPGAIWCNSFASPGYETPISYDYFPQNCSTPSGGGGGGGGGGGYQTTYYVYCQDGWLITDYYFSWDYGQTWNFGHSESEWGAEGCPPLIEGATEIKK